MGFWDVTKRMIQGKPAFEAPKGEDNWDDDAPTDEFADERQAKKVQPVAPANNTLYDDKGYKQPPTASVINIRADVNGKNLDVWATIKNQSDRAIQLDKITMLGTQFILNYPLSAGSQRDFRVYNGPLLTHDSYKKAELYYKDAPTGDYFRADHLIKYRYEANKTYDIVGFDLLSPIVDV